MIDQPVPIRRALAALNLAIWLLLLATREPTPWSELEARRPVVSATGISMDVNTAWGLPVFGKEFGGCFRESPVASLFLLANTAGLMAAAVVFVTLEVLPVPVSVASYIAGVVILSVTSAQWWILGVALEAGRRHRARRRAASSGQGAA